MYKKLIVDADICIKLGSSKKYPFSKMPESACRQLEDLVFDKKIIVVNEKGLEPQERRIYDMIYNRLAEVLIDPRRPNKNKGEVCSLAYAKVKTITVFATDERDLQSIIDTQLNIGLNDIRCIRIIDIINLGER